MSSKNIIGNVITETAEDETVIISKIEWDIKRDEGWGWGWCGREEESYIVNQIACIKSKMMKNLTLDLSQRLKRIGKQAMREQS